MIMITGESRMHMDDVHGPSPNAEASGSRNDSPWDGSESAPRTASEDSLLARSTLDFGQHRGVHVRRNGLSLPNDMPFDSWRELGSQIVLIVNCSAWWVGDWLVYGEKAYGDRYEQAITDTSLAYQTLRNYAWVARRVPVSRRRDTLSFAHHAEVASLPDSEQDVWLARAERLDLSREKLRRELRTAQFDEHRVPRTEGSVHSRALKINVPTERHDLWQSAAERTNCSVGDWIITKLDLAANEDLNNEPPL